MSMLNNQMLIQQLAMENRHAYQVNHHFYPRTKWAMASIAMLNNQRVCYVPAGCVFFIL